MLGLALRGDCWHSPVGGCACLPGAPLGVSAEPGLRRCSGSPPWGAGVGGHPWERARGAGCASFGVSTPEREAGCLPIGMLITGGFWGAPLTCAPPLPPLQDKNRKLRPLYDIPYMFEAREFLRKKLIGKKVWRGRGWWRGPRLSPVRVGAKEGLGGGVVGCTRSWSTL